MCVDRLNSKVFNSFPFHLSMQDFNLQSSLFIIPKTKKRTEREKQLKNSATKNSTQGKWHLRTNGCKKIPTQLQLAPDAQGRPKKRTNASEDGSPKKIRRSWLNTPVSQSSEEAQSQDNGGCTSEPSKGKDVFINFIRIACHNMKF